MVLDEKQRTTILLVDDDKSHVDLSLRAFEERGHSMQLVAVDSISRARIFLAREIPSLAIVDLRLPDGTGMELLDADGGLRLFPVVVLTGQGDEHAAVEAMKAGALDYIVKTPGVFADLPHIAQRALKQWQDIVDRQRAQESLVASEKRFRSLLESAPDAIVISDTAGTIQVVNAQAEEMFGYSRDKLIGKPVEVLIPAPLRQGHVRERQSFFAAPIHRSMCRGRDLSALRKDGSIFPVEISLSSIAMDVGLLAVAAIRDVTERAEAAQKLRDAKLRYRALFEQSSDGVVVVDPETGNVLEFSDRAPLHLGYTREEFAQLGISDIEALETPADYKQHVKRIATTGSEVFETKHRTKQGEIRDVEVRATRITVGDRPLLQASWHDVTDRKQVEISLRQSEGLYRSLVEMLPQGIFRKDADGRVTFANQRYCNLVGREVDDVVGKTDLDLFPHDLAKKYQRDDRQVMETGEILETIDEHHGADGAERFVHVVEIPTLDAAGQCIGVQGIFWDITERKQEQDALREANINLERALADLKQSQEQVVRQERLRALGQMASGAAHDLNNSLSPVLGYADLLSRDLELSPRVREWVELIRVGASDAAAVVERLRQFYGEHDVVQPTCLFDLNDVLRQIPQLTRPKWRDEAQQTGREIAVRLDLGEVPPINGVESELRQVLTNLVLNAVDALPAGGEIVLHSHAIRNSAVVEVSDNGIGMTDDERRRCFEPFFTTKTTGSGLGLSACHGILRRHDVKIEIESIPAHGTTFRLIFPTLDQERLRDREEPPMRSALPRRRILYIDDDPRLRPLVAELLQQLDQSVDLAEDGATGLLRLKREEFDVVITDLGMSGMDGRLVMRTIRQWWPDLPVIMLTGWSEEVALRDMEPSERPTVFLQKPPTLEKLREALARVQVS